MHKVALVTGAAGFIGRHVARRLANDGWKVTGIGHGDKPSEDWGVSEWYESSLTAQALLQIPDSPALVVHCAGSGSVAASLADPENDRQKTVESSLILLEYLRNKAPKAAIVYPSSAAVYGLCDPHPIPATQALQPVSPYGQHKCDAEKLFRAYAAEYGLKVAIVRLFSVYGPGLKKQLLWDACKRLTNGENLFFGTGDETRDWLHVEDAAALLLLAANYASEHSPVINGGSGTATTNRQILQQLASTIDKNSTPEFNQQTRPGDPLHYHADITSAKAWGWQPGISLAKGIEDYVNWFRNQQK